MKQRQLKDQINRTLSEPLLDPELVIRACHTLSQEIRSGRHEALIRKALEGPAAEQGERLIREKIAGAADMLDEGWLRAKLELELGEDLYSADRLPLGVLFHIGAGNLEALSAYSVVEGLLAGNVNLLKLPEGEQGISSALLKRLVQICPQMRPYIYVYSIPSSDVRRIKLLAELADGIVVWGGDGAVSAVRQLARPSAVLIEWRHKLSFAYVTEQGLKEEPDQLYSLARHMLDTDQLLCSSCQGIYLDTESGGRAKEFGREFLQILDAEAEKRPMRNQGFRARNTLRVYSGSLEAAAFGRKEVFCGRRASVTVMESPELEGSLMFGNCWVKRLPKKALLGVLRENSGILQTVGLVCGREEGAELSYLLRRAGAVRVCSPGEMSALSGPQPHDGEYPLRRYSKMCAGVTIHGQYPGNGPRFTV